jgi:CheY-like chemotaxis protein
LRAWLSAEPQTARTPKVWLLLSAEERRPLRDLMEHPGVGYLLKPVRASSLLEHLDDGAPTRLSLSPLHVLIADDDEVSRRIITAHLEKLGHRVSPVSSGEELFQSVVASPSVHHLLIVDLEMPGMGGLAAARAIRGLEAADGRARVPMLALTAHTGARAEAVCRDAGMDGLLSKPVERAALERAVERMRAISR